MSDRSSLIVVYFAARKAELLRDCVLPLALSAAKEPGIEHCYVERHWRFGPHLKICLKSSAPSILERVLVESAARVRDHLGQKPSTETLDEGDYLRLSESLGRRELVPPPYGPLYADNTCFTADHLPRVELIGGPEAVDFYERYQMMALGPVLKFIESCSGANENSRLNYALALLVILAASYPRGGLFSGQLSLRSHLEEFLLENDASGKLRSGFAQRYERAKDRIISTVRALKEQTEGGRYTGDDPLLKTWAGLYEQGWPQALELARRRVIDEEPAARLRAAAGAFDPATAARWAFDDTREYSPFHQELRSFNWLEERVDVFEFSAYRWLLNLQYILMPLLDISPIERLYLTYVITEASESVYGRTWQQHFAEVRARFRRDEPK